MFVSTAFAQAGPDAAAGPGALQAFLPLILIFVVFYFLLIRPQQKKMKHHKEMLTAIRRGDRIVTGGGIVGTVTKVIDDNDLQVEIAEGVRVRVQRQMVANVLAKTEPGPPDSEAAQKQKEPAAESETKGAVGGSRLKKMLGGKSE